MLSQRLATRDDEREHLIVELKRPLQKIDEKVFGQITKYAMAVARDERFRDTKTSWTFIAVSNEMDDFVRMQARQPGRPRGVIGEIPDAGVRILARTWAEVIEECRGRHEFFRRQLDYNVNREAALDHLRRTHEKYFPPVFATRQPEDAYADEEADSLRDVS